jgi:hypothetical protein
VTQWSLVHQEGTLVNNFGAGVSNHHHARDVRLSSLSSSAYSSAAHSATHIAVLWAELLCIDALMLTLTTARAWHVGEADSLSLIVRRDGAASTARWRS